MQLRNFFWIVLWVSITTLCIAQPENNFDRGNTAYRNGDYNAAVKLYESVLEDGKHSADLYFNLGNAYYKLEKLGPSVFYYEKGLQVDPKNKDIQNNLKYAQQATIDEIIPVSQNNISQTFNSLVQTFSSNTWAVLAVLASILAASLFLMYYFTQ